MTDTLARTIRRTAAVLAFALGLVGLALVRGNGALVAPLLLVPPLYLVVEYVFDPLRTADGPDDATGPD